MVAPRGRMSLRIARRDTHRRDAGQNLGGLSLAGRDGARPVHDVAPRRAFDGRSLGREKWLVPPRDGLSADRSSDRRVGGSWWLVTDIQPAWSSAAVANDVTAGREPIEVAGIDGDRFHAGGARHEAIAAAALLPPIHAVVAADMKRAAIDEQAVRGADE